MPNIELRSGADDAANRLVDRRTLLVGAAGALAAGGLSWTCARRGIRHVGRRALRSAV